MIEQGELPLRNSGAATADWIGRAEDRAIYAYDLGALPSEGTEGADFTPAHRRGPSTLDTAMRALSTGGLSLIIKDDE
jgi:hypothetical protein